jgi:DNA-binding CsgD family transcriptional regulator
VGEDPVAALIEHEMIRVTPAPHPQLRLWHSVYADTLRNLISPARSLQLRQSLLRLMDNEPTSAEGLLRQVSWSIECGAEVEDRQLLRAAVLASRLHEDELARKAAALVKDPELQVTARAVTARTYFNTSDYASARDILDADFAKGLSVAVLLTGTMMWAAVQAALGQSPADIMDRAGALLEAAEQLARDNPDDAEQILAETRERYTTIHAMVFALAGEYPDDAGMEAEAVSGAQPPPGNSLEAAFRLALTSERLLVQGKSLQSFAAASEALESAGAGHEELYFLAQFLVARAAAAAIHGGDWEAAENLLAGVTGGPGPNLNQVGGGVHAAQGIILLYQGRAAQALNTLSAALESLRLADPQQLFAITSSMAFAAAAEVGDKAKAGAFLADYEAAPRAVSRYLRNLSQMAVTYGKARLGDYPGAVDELRALGRPRGDDSTAGLELDSLAFCLALGDRDSATRLLELQPELEGPRAAAICRYAAAVSTDLAADYLEAGKSCEDAELWGFAVRAYEAAVSAYRATGDTLRERMAMSQRKRCMDRADSVAGQEQDADADALGLLTRRERDIVALAVRGLTDRQIAAELQVSIRTVEGHLYRSYAKLNIKGRDQLPGVS